MKLKVLSTIAFLILLMPSNAKQLSNRNDSTTTIIPETIDPDSILENLTSKRITTPEEEAVKPKTVTRKRTGHRTNIRAIDKQAFDSLIVENRKLDSLTERSKAFENEEAQKLKNSQHPSVKIDSLALWANPFFIELVYENIPLNFNWGLENDFRKLNYGGPATTLHENVITPIKQLSPYQFIDELRCGARKEITRTALHLYVFRFDQLPDPNRNRSHLLETQDIKKIYFVVKDEENMTTRRKLVIQQIKISPWSHRSNVMLQFSENVVSSKWYQGGNNNVAVLGILAGSLNYDNKKSIQWENNAEWRTGFNSIESTIPGRVLQTNDDVLKINSKLGIRASGSWFYSSSVDFSTQFFNSYKSANSLDKKTAFLTPIRINIGVGLDYKYKRLLSLMLSPISYKYVYMNVRDHVDPNQFGIKKGEFSLKQIGSTFKATSTFNIWNNTQIDSRFSFYTNYEKIEIDLEVVANFNLNRFMAVRISFNPRYDNTVIEKVGDKAVIQYKQFMSIGFSHKFR